MSSSAKSYISDLLKKLNGGKKVVIAKGRQAGKSSAMASVTAMLASNVNWGATEIVQDPNDKRPQEVKDLLKKMGYKPTWERFKAVPRDRPIWSTASYYAYQPSITAASSTCSVISPKREIRAKNI